MNLTDLEQSTGKGAVSNKLDDIKPPASPEPESGQDDRYLRLLAEFDNYRKRTERERERFTRLGKRSLIMKLLELADGLDQALGHVEDSTGAVGEGLRVVHRQLLAVLRSEGVTPFESVGQRFNPDLHEAVSVDDSSDVETGTVIKEFQKGYKWGDEIIRHARVNVSR